MDAREHGFDVDALFSFIFPDFQSGLTLHASVTVEHALVSTEDPQNMAALERHYSATEIAELWNIDPKTVREIFRREPGVLKIERPERRSKRAYTTLRIPESVLLAVHKRLRS